jgi:hypothetical protein
MKQILAKSVQHFGNKLSVLLQGRKLMLRWGSEYASWGQIGYYAA